MKKLLFLILISSFNVFAAEVNKFIDGQANYKEVSRNKYSWFIGDKEVESVDFEEEVFEEANDSGDEESTSYCWSIKFKDGYYCSFYIENNRFSTFYANFALEKVQAEKLLEQTKQIYRDQNCSCN